MGEHTGQVWHWRDIKEARDINISLLNPLVGVYERAGKSVILAYQKAQKGKLVYFFGENALVL